MPTSRARIAERDSWAGNGQAHGPRHVASSGPSRPRRQRIRPLDLAIELVDLGPQPRAPPSRADRPPAPLRQSRSRAGQGPPAVSPAHQAQSSGRDEGVVTRSSAMRRSAASGSNLAKRWETSGTPVVETGDRHLSISPPIQAQSAWGVQPTSPPAERSLGTVPCRAVCPKINRCACSTPLGIGRLVPEV